MHIRPLHPPDIPACSTLSLLAFLSSPIYAYTHPTRHAHLPSLRRQRLRALRKQYYACLTSGGKTKMWVCVSDPGDEALHGLAVDGVDVVGLEGLGGEGWSWSGSEERGERVVGYAVWKCVGGSLSFPPDEHDEHSEHSRNSTTTNPLLAHLNVLLTTLESHYHTLLPLSLHDPAAHPPSLARWTAYLALPNPTFDALTPHIHLSELCTAPFAQRRGVGGRLVEWGLGVAEALGVPVSLTASQAGEGLYRRMGFVVVDWPSVFFGEGGARMVYEGEGRKGEWVERGGRWVLRDGRRRWVEGWVRGMPGEVEVEGEGLVGEKGLEGVDVEEVVAAVGVVNPVATGPKDEVGL